VILLLIGLIVSGVIAPSADTDAAGGSRPAASVTDPARSP
jgi:hypothetical protein